MRKFRFTAFATALLMLAGLTACVPKADGDAGKSKVQSSSTGEATGSLVNKEGMPIVQEPITYEIAARTAKNKNFKELEYFQKLEEKTNVLIDWNMSSADGWSEKKSLMFASNTLPDAFYGQDVLKDVDIIKYASQGLLIPLNDLIDEYAPNLKAILDANPKYRQQITAPDGNIYSLPTINELSPTTHDKWFINKTWLDQLKLEVPTTMEELETVLQAFKDNDMNGNGNANDEIPFTFRMSSSDPFNRQQGLHSLFGAYGQLDDIYHYIIKDGEILYTPVTEEYKNAIAGFHNLYAKGLLDKEAFTHDANVYVAKIQDPAKIVGMFLGWSRSATAAANKEDFVAIAPLKNPNGEQIWRTVDARLLSKGSFAITNTAETPEALIRWIDESYESQTSLEICQGLIGHTQEITAEGKYQQMKLPEGVTLDTSIHDYSPGNNGTFALMQPTIDKLILNPNLTERKELDKFYSEFNVPAEEMYPNVFFTETEIERVGILQTDIDKFVAQKYAGWIVEGGVEKDWEGYISQLESMKLEEYIQIYKDAYNRYISASSK